MRSWIHAISTVSGASVIRTSCEPIPRRRSISCQGSSQDPTVMRSIRRSTSTGNLEMSSSAKLSADSSSLKYSHNSALHPNEVPVFQNGKGYLWKSVGSKPVPTRWHKRYLVLEEHSLNLYRSAKVGTHSMRVSSNT